MRVTAIKPKYNHSTKRYDIEVIEDADILAAHHGYLVFDDKARCLADVLSLRLIPSWNILKREAVIAWLKK